MIDEASIKILNSHKKLLFFGGPNYTISKKEQHDNEETNNQYNLRPSLPLSLSLVFCCSLKNIS